MIHNNILGLNVYPIISNVEIIFDNYILIFAA